MMLWKDKRIKIIQKIFVIFCIFIVISVNSTNILSTIYNGGISKRELLYVFYDSIFPYNFSSFIICSSIIFIVLKTPKTKIKWYDVIVGAGAGISALLGISFRSNNTWNFIFSAKIVSLLFVLGSIFVLIIVKGYFNSLVTYLNDKYNGDNPVVKFLNSISDDRKRTFLFVFIIWLFWLVMRYPGGLQWDENNQINQFLSHTIDSQHWPVIISVYYGGFVYIGTHLFGSQNFGLFLAILCQVVYGSFIVSYVIGMLKKFNISPLLRIVSLLALSINPIVARYMTTGSKDTLYAITLLWLCGILAEYLLDNDSYNKIKDYIPGVICAVILCLVRKNGVYTVVPLLILLLADFLWRKFKVKEKVSSKRMAMLTVVLIIGVLFQSAFTNILAMNGIPKGSVRESIAVPLQQTARMSRDAHDLVSEEDKEIINRIIDYDYIGTAYTPLESDAVKDTYYGKGMGDLVSYFKVWFKYLFKAPSAYFQAFFSLDGGYLDVNANQVELTKLDPEVTEQFMPWSLEGKFRIFTDFYERLPLVWPVCNIGIQSWLCVYLMCIALDKKSMFLINMALPAFVTFGICLLGPTFANQGIRYMLPVMYSNAFVFCFFIDKNPYIQDKNK